MSGFEIAGVVLAVVPLFIEGGKAYATSYRCAREAANHSQRDKKLRDFYDNFYWETYELQQTIESVVEQLPNLSETRKQEVLKTRNIKDCTEYWHEDADIAEGLKQFLASENDLKTFLETLNMVLRQFHQLVDDKTLRMSKKDLSFIQMYRKMKEFQEQEIAGKATSSFLERFRFAGRTKRREVCLKNLHTWNKRISHVVGYATKKAKKRPIYAVSMDSKPPSSKMRALSRKLFMSLSKYWRCNCPTNHEARVCLATCGKDLPDSVASELYFHFLVRGSERINNRMWHEMMVMIRPVGNAKTQGKELEKICDALSIPQATDSCLQVLVEDAEQQQRVWRLNPKFKQSINVYTIPARSFKSLLLETREPGLLTKRKLALTFAYSVLQLHESPLLSTEWDKDHIYFFHLSTTDMNYEQPYLKTAMDQIRANKEPENLNLFHPNSGILKLAILLIELHFWKPIETFREERHLKDGKPTVNTDLLVAKDLLDKSLSGCFDTYSGAVEACMNHPWVLAGSVVSLEDSNTWNGMFNDVILPLRKEIEWGQMAAKSFGQVGRKPAIA